MRYIFSWDPRKAKDNLHNHHISFEHTATIFHDPQALSIFDVAHSDEEDRWITIGFDHSGRLLVVVHTFHQIDRHRAAYGSSPPGEPPPTKRGSIRRDRHETLSDFSGGERGKFYPAEAELDIPVYLAPDVAMFVRKIAAQKGVDVETLVNDWLRKDMAFLETVMP